MHKFFLSCFFSTVVFGASSEIPAKREFPVNDKINPCVNLYEHACSKTIESFKLREDRKRHAFAFNDSSERILEFKKNYIKQLAKESTIDPMALQLKNFYLSCVDKDTRAKEEKSYVASKVTEIEKVQTKKDWLTAQAKRIHSGNPGFIAYFTTVNFDDPTKTDIVFGMRYSFLPEKSYAKNPDLVKELEVLVLDFFKTIGVSNPEARAKTVLKYELDKQENSLFPTEGRIARSLRRFTTKSDVLQKYPELELKYFLDLVPDSTKIRVFNPKTFTFLDSVAKNYSLDELKTLQMFYELAHKLDQGYSKFYDEAFAFNNKFLGGKKKRSELDEECTQMAMSSFGPEFDYLVLPKIFPNFSSDKVAELVDKIKESIRISLVHNKWLSKKAKKEALRKITKAYMRLVAPGKYEDWKFLPVATYSLDSFIANSEKRDDIDEEREFQYLKELRDIRSWEGVEPLVVNAFYQSSFNQFTMLQGILQYPFYDQNNDLVENLAGIGMVVGHELGHGIDDQGSKYDADGKLYDWMTPKDLAKFKELTKSLIEQYSKAGMNGEFTLGENIGDLVGLTSAYDAAFSGNKLSSEDLKKEQRKFFLSYARSWCEVQLPGVRELRIKSDPHSLGEARVNEIVKHFAGFKEAFHCEDNDPMVLPANKRVHIW